MIAESIRSQQTQVFKPQAEEIEGFYLKEELEDMGMTKREIKKYLRKKISSWKGM